MKDSLRRHWQALKRFSETVSQEAERAFDGSDKQQIVMGYFLKFQNTANSAMILLDRSHVQDARSLVRGLFDNLIALKAAAKKAGYEVFFQKDWVRRRRKFLQDFQEFFGKGTGNKKHDERQLQKLEQAKEVNEKVNARLPKDFPMEPYRLEALIKEFGVEDQYKLFYQHLHDETHSLAMAVSRHYNENGFVSYPDLERLDSTAMSVFWMCLAVLGTVIEAFGLQHLDARFHELDAERHENERLAQESKENGLE